MKWQSSFQVMKGIKRWSHEDPFTGWENPTWLPDLFGQWTAFLCLLPDNFGMQLPKKWATAQNCRSGYKRSAEFHHISQYYGVWTWDIKHFSDQAAKDYVDFWDVKSVFKQAAYYMEWRGPLKVPTPKIKRHPDAYGEGVYQVSNCDSCQDIWDTARKWVSSGVQIEWDRQAQMDGLHELTIL